MAAPASNSQCGVSLVSSSGSGTTFTFTVSYRFYSYFASPAASRARGDKVIFMAARDHFGSNSGWKTMGVWRVWNPGGEPALPLVSQLSPRTGTGADQTLRMTFRKSAGSSLTGGWILVNSVVDARNACYLAYGGGTTLYLLDDTGSDFSGSLQLTGAPGPIIANSQCVVVSGRISTAGDTTELVLNLSFRPSFEGTKLIYGGMTDTAGTSTGWQPLGILTFPGGSDGRGAATGPLTVAPSTNSANITASLGEASCKEVGTGRVIPSCPMEVWTVPFPNSNAHFHNQNRPSSKISTSSGGPFTNSWINITTDTSGFRTIYAQTTQIGQQEMIVACPAGGGSLCATREYHVRYNDIYWVEEKPEWIHIGGNTTGHGGNQYNHWMTSAAAWGLYRTAQQFLSEHPEQGKIAVNDMALPWGGRFDIEATRRWTGDHSSHGRGTSVDIRASPSGAYTIPYPLYYRFEQLCRDYGARYARVEDPDNVRNNRHIHCDF